MFIQIIIALLVLVGVSYAVVGTDRENPQAVRQARQELDNMRGFSFAVARYAASNADFEGVLGWSAGTNGERALSAADSTPASLRGTHMPPGWRAVVRKGGDYVLCAPMSEAAAALLAKEMPEAIRAITVHTGSSGGRGDYLVFGDPQDHKAAAGADESESTTWARACDL